MNNFKVTSTHYNLDGVNYYRTTSLASRFAIKNKHNVFDPISANWGNETHTKKGSGVHQYAHLRDNYSPDKIKYDPSINNRIKSYEDFLKEVMPEYEVVESEKTYFSKKYRFAGTIDKLLMKKGVKKLALMDIKSSFSKKTVQIQLGGYILLLIENKVIKKIDDLCEIFVLVITDKKYKIEKISKLDALQGMNAFKSLLNIHNFFGRE